MTVGLRLLLYSQPPLDCVSHQSAESHHFHSTEWTQIKNEQEVAGSREKGLQSKSLSLYSWGR